VAAEEATGAAEASTVVDRLVRLGTRLARNVRFISGLLEERVPFVVCDRVLALRRRRADISKQCRFKRLLARLA
jgi:hypothetical protein